MEAAAGAVVLLATTAATSAASAATLPATAAAGEGEFVCVIVFRNICISFSITSFLSFFLSFLLLFVPHAFLGNYVLIVTVEFFFFGAEADAALLAEAGLFHSKRVIQTLTPVHVC